MDNIENALVSRQFLQDRLKEEEVVEIDDYFSDFAIPYSSEAFFQPEGQFVNTLDSRPLISEPSTFSPVEYVTRQLQQNVNASKPFLAFTSVKIEEKKANRLESVEDQINKMLQKSSIRKRSQCALYVEDRVYRGIIERLEDGQVFLKEKFGMIWRQIPLEEIYKIKVFER